MVITCSQSEYSCFPAEVLCANTMTVAAKSNDPPWSTEFRLTCLCRGQQNADFKFLVLVAAVAVR
jgi:hypothetical protein